MSCRQENHPEDEAEEVKNPLHSQRPLCAYVIKPWGLVASGAPVFAQSTSKSCDHEELARGSSCHHSCSVSLPVPWPGWALVGTGGRMPKHS